VDIPVDGQPSHRSRIIARGRIAAAAEARPVMPVDQAVLERIGAVDEAKLRAGRLERFRAELRRCDVAGALLTDPINLRYATGTRNMALWTMRDGGRYAFVATEGPVVLFEFASSRHVSRDVETVDEQRASTPFTHFLAGPRAGEKALQWAEEIAGLVLRHSGGNRRLAVDRCDPQAAACLIDRGIELVGVQPAIEQARMIKTVEELHCLCAAMTVCDLAVERIRAALKPGITENQLWSVLHETNIAYGGEWIECRLLASGERTNPWFQECGNRLIHPGDMVGFDTDMVGPHGYLADISRSLVCPGRKPTDRQRRLYELAQAQVLHNTERLRPGVAFREFVETAWPVPDEFVANRYSMMVHGVGLVDEYPSIAYPQDFAAWGYDGVFETNMVVSVESYIGEAGGPDGVKLEEQVLITDRGAVPLSRSPLVDALQI
jgi:Xaa-Pro aminopeptidase